MVVYRQPLRPQRVPQKSSIRRLVLMCVLAAFILFGGAFFLTRRENDNKTAQNAQAQSNEPTFDKTQFSLEDPTSPWVVVNKQRPLSPKTYAPTGLIAPNMTLKGGKTSESMQLAPETAAALEKLNADAKAAGIGLTLVSGYRSYNSQTTIYNSEVKGFGQAVADRESARPGHSEHQTGWAVDLGAVNKKCEIQACFADTPEGKWLAANAHAYGFVIRYAKDKTDITGYVYEPWHLRYVGTDLSEEMHKQNIQTLEEFFNLPSASSY